MFPHTGLINFNCSVCIRTLLHQKNYTVLLVDKKENQEICADYIATPSAFVCRCYVKVLEYLDGFLINSDVRGLIVAYHFNFAVSSMKVMATSYKFRHRSVPYVAKCISQEDVLKRAVKVSQTSIVFPTHVFRTPYTAGDI